ncbi:MAG: AAA family ATPase [Acidimicrobiia bacterium]|nr:AAA family ATPase [Acidimicrobiia bacterium]
MTPFAGLIADEHIVSLLRSEAMDPAGAYLFVGPSSLGKATMARHFAAAVVCPLHGVHEDECAICVRSLRGSHPDIAVVSPGGTTGLGVEQARQVIGRASLAKIESDYAVFIFDEAGTLTEPAANALLKTLEEPNQGTVFVLVAENLDQLPPTVISRCRTIHIGRLPTESIIEGLVDRGVLPENAEAAALAAGGRVGLAVSLATSPDLAEFRRNWLGIPVRLTGRPGDARRLAEEMIASLQPMIETTIPDDLTKEAARKATRFAERALLVRGLEILASWYTDAASVQVGGPMRNSDLPIASLTAVSPGRAVTAVDWVMDAVVDVGGNMRTPLLLADLFTRLGTED